MDTILCNNLERGFRLYQEEYEDAAIKALRSGWYILGGEVLEFENAFAQKNSAKYCVGVDNGLNAISLGLRALGIGENDEVIVQANTYIATAIAITKRGAKPIFVEPDEYYNIDSDKIERMINHKTKAILVTHLYGQASNMERIAKLCKENNLYLVEDCAQSHFAEYKGKNVGTFGEMGFYSFYPTKNLGCFGDGGAIVTNRDDLNIQLRSLRNYGSSQKYYNEFIGENSRLDELQAALLNVKLRHFDELREGRQRIARKYLSHISNSKIILPKVRENASHIWHLFVIRTENRNEFREFLDHNGIKTDVHYPIPPHLSKAYQHLGFKVGDYPITEQYANTVVTLPLYDGMTDEEVEYVINVINKY